MRASQLPVRLDLLSIHPMKDNVNAGQQEQVLDDNGIPKRTADRVFLERRPTSSRQDRTPSILRQKGLALNTRSQVLGTLHRAEGNKNESGSIDLV